MVGDVRRAILVGCWLVGGVEVGVRGGEVR